MTTRRINKLMYVCIVSFVLVSIINPCLSKAAPSPDIKANSSDTDVTIATSDALSITASLNAADAVGTNADWWAAAYTPFGWYYFNAYSWSWQTGLNYSYQGSLFNFPSAELLNISGLPDGTYIFYFGVDTVMNGLLDYNNLYYDWVLVNVSATEQTYNIAEYFPLGQGDTWTYRDTVDSDLTTQTISGTENINGVDAAKMIYEDSEEYQLWTNSNGITLYKRGDSNDIAGCGWSHSVFVPPIILLPTEVSIGVKYTSNFTTNYKNCTGLEDTETSSAEATVEGIEDVTVPAGTFKDCLKLKIKFNNMFSDKGQIETEEVTVWLTKGVGRVKSIPTNGGPDELVSATVGGVHYPQ